MDEDMAISIFTDGSCSPNPGYGGWGALIKNHSTGEENRITGGAVDTTNNKMEIVACIEALKFIGSDNKVDIYTDSKYVKNGINKWISGWKKNGWKTIKGQPVKNSDLWRDLQNQCEANVINWHWVRGHSGDTGNEIADELAKAGRLEVMNKETERKNVIEFKEALESNKDWRFYPDLHGELMTISAYKRELSSLDIRPLKFVLGENGVKLLDVGDYPKHQQEVKYILEEWLSSVVTF